MGRWEKNGRRFVLDKMWRNTTNTSNGPVAKRIRMWLEEKMTWDPTVGPTVDT